MGLLKELDSAFISAMKEKKELDLSVIRMLKSSLKNKSIELIRELTDEEAIAVVRGEVKKRNDSIAIYTEGNREDLADKEKSEIEVLKRFLPAEISSEELKEKVQAVIATLSEEDKANFGLAMKAVMQALKGSVDGATVSALVKEALQ